MGLDNVRSESSKKVGKFEKKLKFYSKVRDTVASLSAKKGINKKKKLRSRQKKLKAYNLSSLSDVLPDLKAEEQPAPVTEFKVNCKSRQKLIMKEGDQLRTVLNHPIFHSDPLAAIHQHLLSTQPPDEKQEKRSSKKGKKAKKQKSKASLGPQSMEM